MDANFLVHSMGANLRSYLCYRSVTPPGDARDTLEGANLRSYLSYHSATPPVDAFDIEGYRASRPDCFIHGGECRGLLFFDNLHGRTLICNPTTREMEFLPPSHLFMDGDQYRGNGFGYDELSEDFKIIRFFKRTAGEEYTGPLPVRAEIYSFKTNCWKEISCIQSLRFLGSLSHGGRVATHVNGILYWVATVSDPGDRNALLSFNLATEAFSIFPLPYAYPFESILNKHKYAQDMVELDGELGAFVYEHPGSPESAVEHVKLDKAIQIWVWKHEEGSWAKLFRIPFDDVVRPLGLKHNLLFLEGKTGGGFTQLRVYDLTTNKLENLDVCARVGHMQIFPYTRSTHPLRKDAEDATVQ